MDELMKVAAKVFKAFLEELDCRSGMIEVKGEDFRVVANQGNEAHFVEGKL